MRLAFLKQWLEAANPRWFVEIQTQNQTGTVEQPPGKIRILGCYHYLLCSRKTFQLTQKIIRYKNLDFLAERCEHVRRRQCRTHGIAIGRHMRDYEYIVRLVDKRLRQAYVLFVDYTRNHCF